MVKKKVEPKRLPRITCTRCGEERAETQYWKSDSEIYRHTQKFPVCTQCMEELFVTKYCNYKGILDTTYAINPTNIDFDVATTVLYELCRMFDLPFYYEILRLMKEKNQEYIKRGELEQNYRRLFGIYKNQLNFYNKAYNKTYIPTFSDSDPFGNEKVVVAKMGKLDKVNIIDEISPEVVIRWGKDGFSKEDYLYLEDYTTKLKEQNRVETVQDEDYVNKIAMI